MRIGRYETHPAADLFPLIEGQEFRDLCKSLIERGLEKPIELYEGKVIDGRNRLRACLEVHCQPRVTEWDGDDPYEYVWSANAVRRHLEPGQRAAIRLKVDDALRELAERRRAEANTARSRTQRVGARNPTSAATVPPTRSTKDARETRTELARRAEVSPRTAQKAITVQKASPALAEKVATGEVTLAAAYRQVTKQPPPAPPGVARLAKLMSELDRGANNLQVRISEVVRILETKNDLRLVGAAAWSVAQRLDLLADQISAFTAGLRTRGDEATA